MPKAKGRPVSNQASQATPNSNTSFLQDYLACGCAVDWPNPSNLAMRRPALLHLQFLLVVHCGVL
jgi:hypothetical protein